MTDPAGIAERGAERSAPRSRSGPSAADVNGVARSGANLVSSDVAEETVIGLDREPPDSRRQLERCLTVANRFPHDPRAIGAGRAVERGSEALSWIGVPPCEIWRIRAKLRAKGGGTTTGAIASLTSASRDGDARHVRVVTLSVLDRVSVASHEAPSLPVQ